MALFPVTLSDPNYLKPPHFDILYHLLLSNLPGVGGGFNPPNNILTLRVPHQFQLLGVDSNPLPVKVVIGCHLLEHTT